MAVTAQQQQAFALDIWQAESSVERLAVFVYVPAARISLFGSLVNLAPQR